MPQIPGQMFSAPNIQNPWEIFQQGGFHNEQGTGLLEVLQRAGMGSKPGTWRDRQVGVGFALLPQILSRIQQGNQLIPQIGRISQRLANPGTTQSRLDEFRNSAFTNAAAGARQAGFAGAAQGSPSFGQSSGQMLFGQAVGDVNSYERYLNSPQFQMEMLQVMELLQGIPNIEEFIALMNPQIGQSQRRPNEFGGLVGSVLGGLAGNPGLFDRNRERSA